MIQIDLLIIGLFLLITLIIGLYYGRGIKTFQDYAVGNKKMSTMVITLSLIATTYGGSILSSRPEGYYRSGLHALIMDLASPINFYIASRFILLRMKEFVNHFSIAESMGSMYGAVVRVVTAIFGIMITVSLLTVQVKVGQIVITSLLPSTIASDHATMALTMLSLLFIGYTTLGGSRSVAITDVYQFLLFGLCFPMLIPLFLYHAEDLGSGYQKLMRLPTFNPNSVFQWNDMLKGTLTYVFCRTIFPFDPARIQRFYMAASVYQAASVFNKAAIIRILLTLSFLSLAIALHIGHPIINPDCNVMNYIIGLTYFPGIRGLLITIIIALLMSTADSNLHAATVLFSNDIYAVIRKSKPSLVIIRITAASIGILSIVVALHTTPQVTSFLYKMAGIYTSVVAVPFIIACIGFRPRPIVLLLNMALHTIIASYRIYVGYTGSQQLIFQSIMHSAFTLIAIHYVFPKRPYTGWTGIPDDSPWKLHNQMVKRWLLAQWQKWKYYFHKDYWESIFPRKENTFIWLGIYSIVNTLIVLCAIEQRYLWPYIYGYMAIMTLGTIIALYPALHAYQKGGTPLLHGLWPMVLWVVLFIAPLQFAKLGQYSPMVCALLIASISLSIVLVSVECSSMLLFCALLIHKFLPPYVNFVDLFWGSLKHASVLELVLATAVIASTLVGFVQYKYLRDKSVSKGKVMDITRAYEQRIALEAIYSQAHWARLDATAGGTLLREMGDTLQETTYSLSNKDRSVVQNEITLFNKKLQKFSDCLAWRAQEERSLKLNKKSIQPTPLEPTILKVNQQILDLGEPLALLLRNQTPIIEIAVDPALLECLLLLNLWAISKSQQATDHIVTLTLAATTLQYGLGAEASANQMPLTLPALAFCFSTDTSLPNLKLNYRITAMNANSTLPASEAQFYQLESKQIVEAHGGYVEIIASPTAVSCLYVFPLDGRKVMRFKTYDPADLVANKIAETAESLAQEQELIGLLTAQTTLKEERIQETIAFIKKAHGLVRRKSGSPYYTHPMEVAKLLLEATQDPATILAGLLHDIVEDTPVTLPQLELMYGSEVAAVVDQVTHYNTNGYPWELDKVENKHILHQCRDIRVVQVKLADRLHNMRTLSARKPSDQQRIAKETLAFYIPWGKNHKAPPQWLAEMQQICEKILK
ncbi:MAG: HD domain-containing protein [Candidatus Cardinium sp.]|nr:HD domain-containing protein [Candidatus Cardinium sp.]